MAKLFSAVAVIVLATAVVAANAETSQEDTTKQLVKKAVAQIKKNGAESACKDFADPAKGFIFGESYVYVQDMQAKMICNAGNSKLNGKELLELKDANGKAFNREMVEVAKTKGSGWVTYTWLNPLTKQLQPKTSYVERVDDLMVGSGFYK